MKSQCSLVPAIVVLFIISCVMPGANSVEEGRISLLKQGDTLSGFEKIVVHFSQPVKEPEQVCFTFDPPLFSHSFRFSETADKAYIDPGEPMKGGHTYTLTLCNGVYSVDGKQFKGENARITFHTHPIEQEPNDTPQLADTIYDQMSATLSTSTDVDWFVIGDTGVYGFEFSQYDLLCSVVVMDSSENTISETITDKNTIITIPAEFSPPVFIAVNSFQNWNGGYYHIRLKRE
ncbi:hypothetical protein QA601_00420 [Chitinispirillales bacterium ANBcel5]|uniref:hypothetical protein n=1 Tax=Cellulosispirillum alkaliphilum TaxID=3039283 RepID=UPI002A55CC4E|nr:hypothetical protein [Chitinispirillales bacterium ANBcel5]